MKHKHTISSIEPNSVIGSAVYYDKDFILFFSNTTIRKELKHFLLSHHIDEVYSEIESLIVINTEEGTEVGGETETSSVPSQNLLVHNEYVEPLFKLSKLERTYSELYQHLKKIIGSISINSTLSYKKITDFVYDEVLPVIRKTPHVFLSISEFIHNDNSDYSEIVNFMLKNLLFTASLLELDKARTFVSIEKKTQVAITCMLSNVGMISVLEKVATEKINSIFYSTKLNKIVPKLSFKILRNSSFPYSITQGVLESREHFSQKIEKKTTPTINASDIARFAFIINIYVYLVSFNLEQDSNPLTVLKKIVSLSSKEFDPDYIREFIAILGKIPPGTFIELKNGVQGVTFIPENLTDNVPLIQVLRDSNGIPSQKIIVMSLNSSEFKVKRLLGLEEIKELRAMRKKIIPST